ncbi:hypothetical protein HG530_012073 [Fusarium avenaceum]|nr:hypothetical protein HG530_012073 [Fusarium avenaceum]
MTSLWATLPTRHAPECLDAPVNITLAFKHPRTSVLNGFSLPAKICQSAGADSFSLVGKSLAGLETLGASIEAAEDVNKDLYTEGIAQLMWTYLFIEFLQCSLGLADSSLSRLASQFGDLIQLLV